MVYISWTLDIEIQCRQSHPSNTAAQVLVLCISLGNAKFLCLTMVPITVKYMQQAVSASDL